MRVLGLLCLIIFLLINAAAVQAQVKAQPKKNTIKKPVNTRVKQPVPSKPKAADSTVNVSGARVKITTDMGEIVVRLSDKTPQHRDNFLKLVSEHFYDSLLFHRVIDGFMIQGGDPESKNALPDAMLGKGGVGYTIPAEFDSTLYHKRGALAAARTNNPEKASSGCQFYIVQGKKYADDELNMIELQHGIYFSPAKRMTYKMVGGTPNLDMNYTVFGEVESGMEVVDQIARAQKNSFDRPLTDIHMKMEILK